MAFAAEYANGISVFGTSGGNIVGVDIQTG